MKRYFLIGLMVFILAACSFSMVDKPSEVCPPPEGQESWICDKSAELGVTPEKVYGWIYSATAIAAITEVAKIEDICEFEQKIADWYVVTSPISYESIIAQIVKEMKLIDDPRKFLLIKNILSENLIDYSSPMIVKPYDDWMLKAGHNKFQRDMLCDQ